MGQPKALLAFRGGTFLSVLGETLRASCSPVFAVFGCSDADELMKKRSAVCKGREKSPLPRRDADVTTGRFARDERIA